MAFFVLHSNAERVTHIAGQVQIQLLINNVQLSIKVKGFKSNPIENCSLKIDNCECVTHLSNQLAIINQSFGPNSSGFTWNSRRCNNS